MGWKASFIVIHQPGEAAIEQLLPALGYRSLTPIAEQPFEAVINPKNGEVYIGRAGDNIIICSPDIPERVFSPEGHPAEAALSGLFPDSEIGYIILHSAVNLWGYIVTKGGRRLRVRAGSSEDGTFADEGEPLPEELGLLSGSRLTETGERLYGEGDDEMTEDQMGEEFVFFICQRYFGERLDFADDILSGSSLQGYTYSQPAARIISQTADAPPTPPASGKPWWRFW